MVNIVKLRDHLFDLTVGKARKEEGMARVLEGEPEFKQQFSEYLANLPHGWIGQCEDIRREWTGKMPHPNAWGACWNAAVRGHRLIELSHEVSMTAKKSHGRKTHLYRKP